MKAKLKSTVAKEYRISYSTFVKWLNDMPDLEITKKQRLLSPRQIEMIYDFYGNPN